LARVFARLDILAFGIDKREPMRRLSAPGIDPRSPLGRAGAAIVACERCPRLREYCARVARQKRKAFRDETYWGRPVPGFGDPRARVLLVGLAPAAHGANRTGRMFTGDGSGGSGDFLMAALNRAGFASLPTSTDRGDGLVLHDTKPTPHEIANCQMHLDAEFDALPRVRVVVALGRVAFDASLRLFARHGLALTPRPAFGHGARASLGDGRTLLASYHPSRQNTHTGTLTPAMIDDVFRQVRRLLRNGALGPPTRSDLAGR
jgi:uracil-DNA glycosylase family 4